MITIKNRFFSFLSPLLFVGILVASVSIAPFAPKSAAPFAEEDRSSTTFEIAPEVNSKAPPLTPQELALTDQHNRLAEDFKIPSGMQERVSFWLDVYSKYDSKKYLVHHREYPWVIFDIADTTDLFTQGRVAWLNRRDADTLSEHKKDSVIATLKMLSMRASYDDLPQEEARIFEQLKVIPGPRKKIIREAIKSVRIQLGQKDIFETGLIRSSPFISMMEEIFEDNGLPKELVRLPLVESSFNIEAHSRVGARGAWQIMPGIGQKGLIISPLIDERESPLKSTQFAAFLLKQNKRILKTWPLAVTAYNHGSGSLLKAIRKLKTTELQRIIDTNNERSFQFASSNFYACFMAALRGEIYAAELFPDLKRPESMRLTKVTVPKTVAIGAFAKKNGFAIEDLQATNPELPSKIKAGFKLPAGFSLYVRDDKPESKDQPPPIKITLINPETST
ncbi:MAG: lytic transglycosylase domain-containing protein [Bdellovibrionaceae bacterium]|nr:lytic transglycosylase domain-containing protein [Pseudobdellovibrionaceae bacterium]